MLTRVSSEGGPGSGEGSAAHLWSRTSGPVKAGRINQGQLRVFPQRMGGTSSSALTAQRGKGSRPLRGAGRGLAKTPIRLRGAAAVGLPRPGASRLDNLSTDTLEGPPWARKPLAAALGPAFAPTRWPAPRGSRQFSAQCPCPSTATPQAPGLSFRTEWRRWWRARGSGSARTKAGTLGVRAQGTQRKATTSAPAPRRPGVRALGWGGIEAPSDLGWRQAPRPGQARSQENFPASS